MHHSVRSRTADHVVSDMPSPLTRTPRLSALMLAVLGSVMSLSSQAFEIDTGNPDAVLRWDNTARYNYGVRMKDRDPALLANPNYDDGNRNFAKGQAVTNRLDVLSEMDLIVNKQYGFRLSGALWADAAYNKLSSNAESPNTYNGNGGPGTLSDHASRFAKGPSGELLDAFVFANIEVGDMPVSARLGRHTAYWGEGLMLGGAVHGVSYGQYALDIWKSSATPGAESKELFRPREGLTVQFQPTNELTVAAQTFFDWEAARVPESGTYLGGSDPLLFGAENFWLGLPAAVTGGRPVTGGSLVPRGRSVTPNKTGDYGLSMRWSPEWLDGTAGLYVRRTADIAQQSWLANGQYHLSFGRGINIFGASLSKNIAGLSVGAELSMRHNMPLISMPALSAAVGPTAALAPRLEALAAAGELPGARGKTAHAVLNVVGILPQNPLFDSASLAAELTWMRVLSVTSDPFNLYKGTAAYRNGNNGAVTVTPGGGRNIDAVTRDATSLSVTFNPVWLGALPSVDLSMPMAYSVGLSGNAGVLSGGFEKVGSWSIGLAADIQSKYNLSLRYVAAFGPYSTNAAGVAMVPAATNSTIKDRDMLVLTFKTTF